MKTGQMHYSQGINNAGNSAYCPGAWEERCADIVNGDPHHNTVGDSPAISVGRRDRSLADSALKI